MYLIITSEIEDPENLTITRIDNEDETINILIEKEGDSLGVGVKKLTHYHSVYYPNEDKLEYTKTVVGKIYADGTSSTEDDITIYDSGDINGNVTINALDLLQLKKYIY